MSDEKEYGDPADLDEEVFGWMQMTIALALRRADRITDPADAELSAAESNEELTLCLASLFGNRKKGSKLPLGQIVEAIIRRAYGLIMEDPDE